MSTIFQSNFKRVLKIYNLESSFSNLNASEKIRKNKTIGEKRAAANV